MGREIRRVPPNWKHPEEPGRGEVLNSPGMRFKALFQGYEEDAEQWRKGFLAWEKKSKKAKGDSKYFWEYEGSPPDKENYVDYVGVKPTWYQVYQTVSEGTPVTPPFATKEDLAQYLATHGDAWDQARGHGPWNIEAARKFVGAGWAPSGIVVPGKGFLTARNMDQL